MPRSRPEGRLEQVVSAATRVFAEKGYARTQMADIAREARLSAGALYGYATSKDALFHWCIEAAVDRSVLHGAELPLPAVEWSVTAARARGHLEDLRKGNSALAAALRTRQPDNIETELAAIIGEIYDRTFASRRLQAIVERSALDIPELYDAFFRNMRRPVIDVLTKYLRMRMADGYIRSLADVGATARLMLETQSWFARNRPGDPDAADIDDTTARATVIDFLTHGLLPGI